MLLFPFFTRHLLAFNRMKGKSNKIHIFSLFLHLVFCPISLSSLSSQIFHLHFIIFALVLLLITKFSIAYKSGGRMTVFYIINFNFLLLIVFSSMINPSPTNLFPLFIISILASFSIVFPVIWKLPSFAVR